ncbi:hypothetical protein [Nocardiopsis sp. JB363]|uniref:hypothetical protein n=1 Tax=Nocardiopsis sp. JB363 TaxID=1434837 RepID=UPI00097AD530|nr:hypothetical protein [Nocardiopsis sp. JB363]SIO86153.1 hypothetical protein BQ8420_10560 [Nocardiopsis sp. JB363]
MTPDDALALMDDGYLALRQEVEVDTVDGTTVVGLLEDVGVRHLWLHRHDHEDTDHDRSWRTPLSAVTGLHRVLPRSFPWQPRLQQVWPRTQGAGPCAPHQCCTWSEYGQAQQAGIPASPPPPKPNLTLEQAREQAALAAEERRNRKRPRRNANPLALYADRQH